MQTNDPSAGPDALAELVRAAGRRAEPPREDYDIVLRAASDAWQRKVHRRRRLQWIGAVAATLAALAVGLSVVRHWMLAEPVIVASATLVRGNVEVALPGDSSWRPLHAGGAIGAGTRLRTPSGASAAIQLHDGGAVRLRDFTEFAFASNTELRLVRGTVYIDTGSVAREDSLTLATDFGTVRDVGTVFEVRATPDALRVRVREGRVQLDAGGGRMPLAARIGEELRIDARGESELGAFPPADAEWAWAEALVASPRIEGLSLLKFLEWVAHETGRRIAFQQAAIEAQARDVMLHGDAQGLAPMDALDLMLATTDFEYALETSGVILIRRREFLP